MLVVQFGERFVFCAVFFMLRMNRIAAAAGRSITNYQSHWKYSICICGFGYPKPNVYEMLRHFASGIRALVDKL